MWIFIPRLRVESCGLFFPHQMPRHEVNGAVKLEGICGFSYVNNKNIFEPKIKWRIYLLYFK